MPGTFNEEKLVITNKDVIRDLKQELIVLREYEEKKFSSCTIKFKTIFDC